MADIHDLSAQLQNLAISRQALGKSYTPANHPLVCLPGELRSQIYSEVDCEPEPPELMHGIPTEIPTHSFIPTLGIAALRSVIAKDQKTHETDPFLAAASLDLRLPNAIDVLRTWLRTATGLQRIQLLTQITVRHYNWTWSSASQDWIHCDDYTLFTLSDDGSVYPQDGTEVEPESSCAESHDCCDCTACDIIWAKGFTASALEARNFVSARKAEFGIDDRLLLIECVLQFCAVIEDHEAELTRCFR